MLSPPECDDALLSDAILRSYREVTLSAMGMGVVGSKNPAFPVKFLNVLDPLRDDNNLGRSVSKGITVLKHSSISIFFWEIPCGNPELSTF